MDETTDYKKAWQSLGPKEIQDSLTTLRTIRYTYKVLEGTTLLLSGVISHSFVLITNTFPYSWKAPTLLIVLCITLAYFVIEARKRMAKVFAEIVTDPGFIEKMEMDYKRINWRK